MPDAPRDVEPLMDVDNCGRCHPGAVRTWQASAHARASFDNPWYRQAVDDLRAEEGGRARSRFCAGCHDPLLLVAGAMDNEVRPDDRRTHAGVTCLVCHSIRHTRPDGGASYTLSTLPPPIPKLDDPAQIAAHVRALTPEPLTTSRLCGSCHRAFLGPHMGHPHHLAGIDDLGSWQQSAFAGSHAARVDEPLERQHCQGCHMPRISAPVATAGRFLAHDFAASHTALPAASPRRHLLFGAARIDIVSVRLGADTPLALPAEAEKVVGGRSAIFDVVLRNLKAGHRFPGGTLDIQDTWVELDLRDAEGRLIAQAGQAHAAGVPDPSAHRLLARFVDAAGRAQRTHRVQHFAAKVWDTTLGPRAAHLIRYRVDLNGVDLTGVAPTRVDLTGVDLTPRPAWPLALRARLRHRKHPKAMVAAACRAQRTERGQAFRRASLALGRPAVDACIDPPITEVAAARVWLGPGAGQREAAGGAAEPAFRRHVDHALACLTNVQEHLDDAQTPIEAGLEIAGHGRQRATLLSLRAELAARQGRLAAALADADRAQAQMGAHPALARIRGDAYAQVWRWQDAALAYRRAAASAPLDPTTWAASAEAAFSAGDARTALDAAQTGLRLAPRRESLLRSRYLALRRLGATQALNAMHAYLAHRVPDALPALRRRCAERDPDCARERRPVHVHVMQRIRAAHTRDLNASSARPLARARR